MSPQIASLVLIMGGCALELDGAICELDSATLLDETVKSLEDPAIITELDDAKIPPLEELDSNEGGGATVSESPQATKVAETAMAANIYGLKNFCEQSIWRSYCFTDGNRHRCTARRT
jgi:hypothetical protein